MTAYSENDLYQCDVVARARDAYQAGVLSKESRLNIEQAYPCKLYSPHFFIAIALGLLTIVSVIFTGALIWLVTGASSGSIGVVCILMSLVGYFFLEMMVKSKNYFNAGVDNALMGLILFFSGGIFLAYFETPSWILFNVVLTLISLWLCLRFADAFMAVISCGFFLVSVFLLYGKSGNEAVVYAPFVMMLIIAFLYFFKKKIEKKIKFIYEKCLDALTVFLLLAFYGAGNYWVVSQLVSSVINTTGPIAFGWAFWAFTFLVPVVYIVYGILKKDLLHLRTGLVLVAGVVFTYKYYFTLLPVEIEMLIAGLLMVALSYFFITWLQSPRYGFTSENTDIQPAWKNVEALIIAETMGGYSKPFEDPLMAGGSGGGAGAGGEF